MLPSLKIPIVTPQPELDGAKVTELIDEPG